MDYESYRQLRDKLIREKRPLRLDCMNPVRALSAWSGLAHIAGGWAEASGEEAMRAWSSATGIVLAPERSVVSRGVRDMLSAIFSVGLGQTEELWLPEDVYPVYWQLARASGAKTKGFRYSAAPRPWISSSRRRRASLCFCRNLCLRLGEHWQTRKSRFLFSGCKAAQSWRAVDCRCRIYV